MSTRAEINTLNNKLEVANKVYDDYHKYVDFKTEWWYDTDIDKLFEDNEMKKQISDEIYKSREKSQFLCLKDGLSPKEIIQSSKTQKASALK